MYGMDTCPGIYITAFIIMLCVYSHAHLSPRSDAINFDTVKSAQFIFLWYETGRAYIALSLFVVDCMVTYLKCPEIFFRPSFYKLLLPVVFVTHFFWWIAWPSSKSQLYPGSCYIKAVFNALFLTQCIWHALNIQILIKLNTKNRGEKSGSAYLFYLKYNSSVSSYAC